MEKSHSFSYLKPRLAFASRYRKTKRSYIWQTSHGKQSQLFDSDHLGHLYSLWSWSMLSWSLCRPEPAGMRPRTFLSLLFDRKLVARCCRQPGSWIPCCLPSPSRLKKSMGFSWSRCLKSHLVTTLIRNHKLPKCRWNQISDHMCSLDLWIYHKFCL